jgi:hypothetical protein
MMAGAKKRAGDNGFGSMPPAQFSLTKTRGKQTILAKFVLTDECLHLRFTAGCFTWRKDGAGEYTGFAALALVRLSHAKTHSRRHLSLSSGSIPCLQAGAMACWCRRFGGVQRANGRHRRAP